MVGGRVRTKGMGGIGRHSKLIGWFRCSMASGQSMRKFVD